MFRKQIPKILEARILELERKEEKVNWITLYCKYRMHSEVKWHIQDNTLSWSNKDKTPEIMPCEITTAELITQLIFYKIMNYFSQVLPKEQGQCLVAHQVEVCREARIPLEIFLWEQIWLPGGTINDKQSCRWTITKSFWKANPAPHAWGSPAGTVLSERLHSLSR